MHLSRIKLIQFKNYNNQELHFGPKLNCIVGQNGMGKTNLLDAIYYLCMGKSYFGISDRYIIKKETDFFRLEGDFTLDSNKKETLVAKIQPPSRKVLENNKIPYDRIAEHIGKFPVVIIVPDDAQLITEGSEIRRRFVDNTLSQLDANYLKELMTYNHVLKQRNALLKQYEGRPASADLLLIYDQQLEKPASYIYTQRRDFVDVFMTPFDAAHKAICGGNEKVQLVYKSGLKDNSLTNLLKESRERDRILQRTTKGIHKDNLVFTLEGQPLKKFGSQGQLKSFVLALKLAQYSFLKTAKRKQPLLLLDDVFDKLDPARVNQLIDYILEGDFGQIFISDTDPDRIQRILDAQKVDPLVFHIINGTVNNEQ